MALLCSLFKYYSVKNKARHMLYTMWSEVWRKKLENMNLGRIIAQLRCALAVAVKNGTIKHVMEGRGCFPP